MSDEYCCEALEEITRIYERPIYRPMIIEEKTHSIKLGGWGVQAYNPTKSGAISKRGRATFFINFCPFCGKQLREM